MTPQQFKFARKLIGWSQEDIAGHLGMSASTVSDFERRGRRAKIFDLARVKALLESEGVEFEVDSEGLGVRLRKAAK